MDKISKNTGVFTINHNSRFDPRPKGDPMPYPKPKLPRSYKKNR
jgi:hypothetical protein